MFVEQPLFSPGSAKYIYEIIDLKNKNKNHCEFFVIDVVTCILCSPRGSGKESIDKPRWIRFGLFFLHGINFAKIKSNILLY